MRASVSVLLKNFSGPWKTRGGGGSVWRFRCDCGAMHEAVPDLKESAKLLIEDELKSSATYRAVGS